MYAIQSRRPRWSVAAGGAVSQRWLHCASEGRLRTMAGFLQSWT